MIQIEEKSLCCGCSACASICPKQCIDMTSDDEGFVYPVVDIDRCIQCGLCEQTCPFMHPYNDREPVDVFAANCKDDIIREQSSSGGIFTLLAKKVIKENGIVFGARFDKDWQVVIDYTETLEGVALFRGSKYVQASMGSSYRDARRFLREGRKVLFAGTPCQIAGLNHFLRREYENLVTVDFVCHGVPSPKVWEKYLQEVSSGFSGSIVGINFRDKTKGWKNFHLVMDIGEGQFSGKLSLHHLKDVYMRAFLQNLLLRPSCSDCCVKEGRSMSDLTIADFWGVALHHPDMDDDRGTSLLLVNSPKGKCLVDFSEMDIETASLAEAYAFNKGLMCKTELHTHRQAFFEELPHSASVVSLMKRHLRLTLKQRMAFMLKFIGWKINGLIKRFSV